MQVEGQQPGMQERLSSAIELSSQNDPAFAGSPTLIAHLVRQAEADISGVKAEQVVKSDYAVRWSLLFVPVLFAWITIALLPATTKTAMAGLYRVMMPWKNTLPTMLTSVVVKPGDVTLVQSDPIDITAHVSFQSGGKDVGRASLIRKFDNGQRVTEEMEKADSRDYRMHLDDLQQSFAYMVTTDQGDSQWYTATVHPRPQISDIEVRCEYPKYTQMSPTVVQSREGTIEAIVGTKVTLTLHTVLPVVVDKSQLVIDETTPDKLVLPLKQTDPNKAEYQVQLTITHSGEYRVNLSNEFDLTNKDEQPRSITALADEVPTIVIRSPEPQVTVRPDDTVPVKYLATDDFAVSKVEAILQVDDHEPRTVPVKFVAKDPRTTNGPPFVIAVADVLKSQELKTGKVLTYQLKVTDNRDPDPQFSFSAKQTLKINRDEYQSFQAKEDRKLAADLNRAIEKAIHELNQEQNEVQPARDMPSDQDLGEYSRKELHKATQDLPKTSRELLTAANEAKDSIYQDVAKKVKEIATKPIRAAAEETTRADLSAGSGRDRQDSAKQAVTKIAEARDALQKLLNDQAIAKDERQAEAARDLADAAKKQQEAADLMKPHDQAAKAQDPAAKRQQQQDQQQAAHKQEEANQKLHQALDQSEALRDPQAQETARQLQDLIHKVEEAEKQQDQVAQQTEKQEAAADIQQKANATAAKQEALNADVQKTAEEKKDALQKANAQPPNKDQQQNIVKELNRNNLQQADQQMKQAAAQLHQEAQQLKAQAKSNDLHPNPQQQEMQNKDQQARQNAQNEQNQAQQAANNLKQQAQQNATPKPDDAAIQNAQQQAREIEKQAADLNPQNADAQAAAKDATQDAQAAEKAADDAAHAAAPDEAKQDLAKAADQLNKAAQELAKAADKNADADKAQAVKSQQEDAKAAGAQVDQQAAAQDALAKDVDAQLAALAQAQQNNPPADQSTQQQNQVAQKAQAAQQQAQQLQHQALQAKNPDVAQRAQDAQAALTEAQHHAAEAAHEQQQAAQAQQQAANAEHAEQAKDAEQQAGKALEQAANEQRQAQDALAMAEAQLRNLQADQPQPAQAQANAQQGEQPGQQASADQQPASEKQQAAQAAQEAAQAQQEASQQNQAAAQQAANALTKAAQAMAKATPGLHPGDPDQGQDPGNEPGQDPSTTPGQTPDSKQGISAASAPVEMPASVRDIGITADQWALLPPLARKDLMNAAQQSGPPTYRQMIKDYYVKVAKIQSGTLGQ
jgi:hypothetical protein